MGEVRKRARGRCEYCGFPESEAAISFEVEHVIPRKHEGETTAENLALACFFCNRYKGPNLAGVDPSSGEIVPLFNPRTDRWAGHFEWNGPIIVSATPVGRATISVLRMNLSNAIDVRRELMAAGLW
ncbi:MAG: HNH endonuclease [Verrucomicrobiae bacterium]|nr:HNH endonuclease [Verrucomicrobiae bacterium]MCP5539634.1 HNH endonuclease [Akkermansiaceae bacterium]MCP5549372.1 HNH endonuclease [Akkermansiaceae bacterium]